MRLQALRNILPGFGARPSPGAPSEPASPEIPARETETMTEEKHEPEQMQPVTSWTPDGESPPRVSEEAVIGAICTVYDPEIPVNIYELGLIYAIEIADNGNVKVEMTLTAPGCPSAQELPEMVRDAIAQIDGVGDITVDTVWDPAWDQSRMSEEARLMLNMF